jgi:hypothetical protein
MIRDLLRLFPVSLVTMAVASSAARADTLVHSWQAVRQSIVVVAWENPDHTLANRADGFCIYSDAHASHFLTSSQVGNRPEDAPQARLVVERVTKNGTALAYPATVVGGAKDSRLAVVSVDLPRVPALRVSFSIPARGQHVAWVSDNAVAEGTVSALQFGTYLIAFDVPPGESAEDGAPLFDPATGAVFGMVQSSIPAPAETSTQKQAVSLGAQKLALAARSDAYSFAISMRVASDFIETLPSLGVAYAESIGRSGAGGFRGASAENPCLDALDSFERAYGLWLQMHGSIRGIALEWTLHSDAQRESVFEAAVENALQGERQGLAAMHAATAAIAESHPPNALLPTVTIAITNAAGRVDTADSVLASQITSRSALTGVDAAEAALSAASSGLRQSMCFF